MKVLLIWPGSRNEVLGWGDLGAVAEPLALEYLAAGAKSHGHEVQLLDLRLHRDELDNTLLDFAPDVVGVTAFSMHVLSALAICGRVKTQLPRCRTVVGGHHATLMPEDFFEPQVDFVVIGEGVRPFGSAPSGAEHEHAGHRYLRHLVTRRRSIRPGRIRTSLRDGHPADARSFCHHPRS